VLFALALLVLIGVAALVFDVGQNFVDRRKEQDVADAAALAAARYLPDCPTPQSNANCPAAVNAAVALATSQGYTNGVNQAIVTVKIPPGSETEFAGIPDTVEVAISSTRGSIFLGVFGQTTQRTAALGVAQNSSGYTLPYSLIALDPNGTTSLTGNGGGITTGGTVHIDSSASPAMKLAGTGVINAPECDVVGTVQVSGGATNGCTSQPTGVTAFGDPLRELPPPPLPPAPAPIVRIAGKAIPNGCPGSGSPATAANPVGCQFSSSYKLGIDSYRLYPGFYPGGLAFQGGTFYLEPGIYWIGGGGYSQPGNGAMVMSVDPGGTTCTPATPGPSSCGVLVYLGQDPDPTIQAGCPASGSTGCFAGWSMNGAAANFELQAIQFGPYQNMVIYIDRSFPNASLTLNGSATNFALTGTVYAPRTNVTVNGNGATSLSAQFIAWDFTAKGNSGAINVPYTADAFFHLKGIGLVQ
jgi:Flp pilus assembly protein TadG